MPPQTQPMAPTLFPTLSPTLEPTQEPTLDVSIQLYKLSYPTSSVAYGTFRSPLFNEIR